MSASDVERITPDVLDRLQRAIDELEPRERPSFEAAQCVLWYVTRWARSGVSTEAIAQVVDGTRLSVGKVRRSLAALAAAGLVELGTRGGGRSRSGSRRRLLFLDKLGTSDRTEFAEELGTSDRAQSERADAELGTELRTREPQLGTREPQLGTSDRTYPPSSASYPPPPRTRDEMVASIVAEAARGFVEHRERTGYGTAGVGARRAAEELCAAQGEHVARWLSNGCQPHHIVQAVTARALGENPNAAPPSPPPMPSADPTDDQRLSSAQIHQILEEARR